MLLVTTVGDSFSFSNTHCLSLLVFHCLFLHGLNYNEFYGLLCAFNSEVWKMLCRSAVWGLRTLIACCVQLTVYCCCLRWELQIPHIATTATTKPRSSKISFVWNTLEVCPWENIRIKGNKLLYLSLFPMPFYNSQISVYLDITTPEQIIV